MQKVQDLQIGSFGLSESNTNVQLTLYQFLTKSRVKGGFPQFHVVMGACKDEMDSSKRHGGVLMEASLGHERRIRKSGVDQDGMGSFLYVTMEAAGGNKLTTILVYRPCAGRVDASGSTIWKQQWSRLQKMGKGEDYDPRTAIIFDIGNFLDTRRYHDIIIGGYFNGVPMKGEIDKHGTITSLTAAFGLLDVHAELNEGLHQKTYYHGTRRINHIYFSDWLLIENLVLQKNIREFD